jgi:DNA-binding response OmpR family regulator
MENILIVEDDLEIAKVIMDYLSSCYKVSWSSTGREAIEDFGKERYSLIILDIMLPEMDGFTVCKNIRLISDVPILIVSAKQEDMDKVRGLKIGADDYITKPFSLIELGARVESHIKRYNKYKKIDTVNNNIINILGGLSIDLDKKLVTLNGVQVELTSKEYGVLILLMQNPNRIFNKTEIYENIWGQTEMDGNNTVTVHVKDLRIKLNDNSKNPKFIQTVWGVGYKFIGEELR